MTGGFVLLGLVGLVVAVWAVARFARAWRLGRAGFGVDSEDRRLRDDPRFTDAWVRQLRNDAPSRGPGDPPAASSRDESER